MSLSLPGMLAGQRGPYDLPAPYLAPATTQPGETGAMSSKSLRLEGGPDGKMTSALHMTPDVHRRGSDTPSGHALPPGEQVS